MALHELTDREGFALSMALRQLARRETVVETHGFDLSAGEVQALINRLSGDVDAPGPEGRMSLDEAAARFGWCEVTRAHAEGSLDVVFENEVSLRLANGKCLCFPAHPAACDYIRVTQAGFELMYWSDDEFGDAPADVMGALMGLCLA